VAGASVRSWLLTGSNIPPVLNENPKTKTFGWLYPIGATVFGWLHILVSIVVYMFMLKIILSVILGETTVSMSEYPVLNAIAGFGTLLFVAGITGLCLALGLKYLKKANINNRNVIVIILCLTILSGYVLVLGPSDTFEQPVKNASGEMMIFRFQKEYLGYRTSCAILDSINKKEITEFRFPNQPGKIVWWTVEHLKDSPELTIYGIHAGIIYKEGNGKYQAASYSSISKASPKDHPDLVPIAQALVSTKEWRWIKMFGAFLLEAGDQDMKDTVKRYAEGRFSEDEVKNNKTIYPLLNKEEINKEDMQAFAKALLRQ